MGEACGGFGDGGREGEGEEVKKYAPWAARGGNVLSCFLYVGECFRREQHCCVQQIDGIWKEEEKLRCVWGIWILNWNQERPVSSE